jgi:hypothetical protein
VYFALDEGNGNRLNNSGSLLPFGTNFGAEWSPFAAQANDHAARVHPRHPAGDAQPQRYLGGPGGFHRPLHRAGVGFCALQKHRLLCQKRGNTGQRRVVQPKIFTDSTGKFTIDFDPGTTAG